MLPLAVVALSLSPVPAESWLLARAPMDRRMGVADLGLEMWAQHLQWEAKQSLDAGRPADAVAALNAALLLAPDVPELLAGRGRSLAACGRHDESADDFARLIALEPNDWTNWVLVGRGWLARGKVDEAQKCFDKAATLCPPGKWRCEARVTEMIAWLGADASFHLTPRGEWATAGGNFTLDEITATPPDCRSRAEMAAVLAVEEGGERMDRRQDDPHFYRALFRYLAGRYADADADFARALETNPTDWRLHLFRAEIAAQRREPEAVARHLKLAEENGCERKMIVRAWIEVHQAAGEWAKAEPFAAEWCELEPESGEAHHQHAHALRLLGRDDEADAATGRAARLLKSSFASLVVDQMEHLANNGSRLEVADRGLTRLLARPELPRRDETQAWMGRGLVRGADGRGEEGYADLTRAVRLLPYEVNTRRHRIAAAMADKRYADAVTDAAALARSRPWDADFRQLLRDARQPLELAATFAGRVPDFRPAGPLQPAPISVSFGGWAVEHLGMKARALAVGP